MRTPLKRLDNAEAVAKGLGCTGVDDALRLLEDETAFGEKLAALGWADRGGYLLERMTPILSRFARQERELLRAFLSGRADLQQVYPAFLAFLGTADTGLEPGPLLESLGFYEREAYALLMEELSERPAQDLVRLLGFGLAEGDYEREIAQYTQTTTRRQAANLGSPIFLFIGDARYDGAVAYGFGGHNDDGFEDYGPFYWGSLSSNVLDLGFPLMRRWAGREMAHMITDFEDSATLWSSSLYAYGSGVELSARKVEEMREHARHIP